MRTAGAGAVTPFAAGRVATLPLVADFTACATGSRSVARTPLDATPVSHPFPAQISPSQAEIRMAGAKSGRLEFEAIFSGRGLVSRTACQRQRGRRNGDCKRTSGWSDG